MSERHIAEYVRGESGDMCGRLVAPRTERNRLAEAFIRGIEAGAEEPALAGDGDAMYEAFRRWADA